ncbi:voltage-gated potassium channel [Desulfonispora thiosulfatigenes DSM 11270]|uniref:Voltage-gated potassium channel n=1 Tax=Desulfonispora thiosulfatigenes DSM 11270 TaxID=656914 RepID=A0A1W1UDI0_DESTI|nr:ion transporter [Desulfonispora thiosulfatigenes]SMB79082.1 voltage-gated potassium channel [Desulfonispora thiosulfatigenes DSM 11270]
MNDNNIKSWKVSLYKIIFEADTPLGKAFDVALIFFIMFSSIIVMAESVESIKYTYGDDLLVLEWFFVIIFTLEYFLRIITVHNKWKYIFSFYGVVDLLTILPAFLSLLVPSAHFLLVIRVLRLLRLFRVFKMVRYVEESGILLKALKASRPKITVFLFTIFSVITIVGSLMYIIEGPTNGYASIPESMYWAIVTITTVGYGDISPQTALGKLLASTLMIMAYGILAVPTGIISFELAQASKTPVTTRTCPDCALEGHPPDAIFCKKCGEKLL